ncbi:hypothetical protein [Trinickia sp.]|uniref:hypothetical protein n=1 Tax=Trinickia sp. TaxID=2571163 RepID=UPI003F7FCB2D
MTQNDHMLALENHYSGDESWAALEELGLRKHREVPTVLSLSRVLYEDLGLACVIYEVIGSGAFAWLDHKLPVLDHIRPLDCVGDPILIKRLREALMRFP